MRARRAWGITDGQLLQTYGLVCGSSIGALNAWFVSTGQYTALRRAWGNLASAHIIEFNKKYAAIMKPKAFALDRIYEYIHFSLAISGHEQAMGRSAPILQWMAEHVVLPMIDSTDGVYIDESIVSSKRLLSTVLTR